MFRKKTKKESAKAIFASVRKEMARPRMAKSTREEGVKQDVARLERKATEEKRVREEEWIKTLDDGRRVKFTNQELLEDGAFITAQLAGNKVVYSIVLTKAKKPLSHEEVESHFADELRKK